MKLLVISPGAASSTCDVEAGLCFGLQHHGHQVWRYRLDMLLDPAKRWLYSQWRVLKKTTPSVKRPAFVDVCEQASLGALHMALRHDVDAVIIVSFMLFHPQIVPWLRKAGFKVYSVFTEAPYDLEEETIRAEMVDGCWTNERSCVPAFRAVQPNSGYLAHGWHPERHFPGLHPEDLKVPPYDVVFVGTMFKERLDWFESINWDGINLGLYGNLDVIPAKHPLAKYCKGPDRNNPTKNAQITNRSAAALYRRAKIGLNLYRDTPPGLTPAESLNPRAYELAACGVFSLSPQRAETREVFGDLVPVPTEHSIREWLADTERRTQVQHALPKAVASASWVERSKAVIGDLQMLHDTHLLQRAG